MAKKIVTPLVFAFLIIVGSFIAFYASNLIFSDISNMFYGVHDVNFIASIPLTGVMLDFVLAFIFAHRYFYRPQYRKAMCKLYLIYVVAISCVGILSSLYTGIRIYDSFTSPYPFQNATIITLIFHVVALIASWIGYAVISSKMPEDEKKRKLKFGYAMYSAGFFVFSVLAFNRFGALLWSPTFVQVRTLYLSWPFYAGLIVPLLILMYTVLYNWDWYNNHKFFPLTVAIVIAVLTLVSNIVTIVIGYNNTTFIASISPMLALERLATLPLDMILITTLEVVFAVITLRHAIRKFKKK